MILWMSNLFFARDQGYLVPYSFKSKKNNFILLQVVIWLQAIENKQTKIFVGYFTV